jgi:hypothetical protein
VLGSGANGVPIDTSRRGPHTFTVSALDGDGASAIKSAVYTVVEAGTPIISGAGETAKRWREDDTLPHISAKKKLPVGTTFSFALNESATAGRQVHRKCVAPTKQNRGKPGCTRTLLAGGFTLAGQRLAQDLRLEVPRVAGRS